MNVLILLFPMLAYKDEYVIGRVDASLISSRVDPRLVQCLFKIGFVY